MFNECLEFMENSMKNDMHDKSIINLCKGILIYYCKDSDEGIDVINDSLNNIDDQKMIEYVKTRFKKKQKNKINDI